MPNKGAGATKNDLLVYDIDAKMAYLFMILMFQLPCQMWAPLKNVWSRGILLLLLLLH